MQNFAQWLRRTGRRLREAPSRRLVNKLILLFTSIIILIVSSLSFIAYKIIERESVAGSVASNRSNLKLVNQNYAKYMSELEQFSLPQIDYDPLMLAIEREGKDYASRLYLEDYLRSLFYARTDLQSIYMYLADEHKYLYVTRERYNVTVRAALDDGIPEQVWYKEAMADPHNRSVQSLVLSRETGYGTAPESVFMAYHRVLRSLKDRQARAVVSFYVNDSAKNAIMTDIPMSEGEHAMLLDANDTPFHADDPDFYASAVGDGKFVSLLHTEESKESFNWQGPGGRYLVVENVDGQEGWRLVKPIPFSEIYRTAVEARRISIWIGIGFLAVAVGLVILTSNAITRPLKRLSKEMSRFGAGDFETVTEVRGRDEIAYLSRHFNLMARRTNELINERYKMKLTEQSAILKALEAEINPHFLYNALQAISTKALKNGNDDVADMVDALAGTLRYCISGKDIVYLNEELKHVERYMMLQKARFGSRVAMSYDIGDELLQLSIPKLSIQSLVENAIKHGVEKVQRPVRILIAAYLEGEGAVIAVRDDGPGIAPDRLREVRASFETAWEDRSGESIGLRNLDARLKLLFGGGAGLEIEALEGGTELRMKIPGGGGHLV
ncbi:sensor histidine kinase [Cohnella sp. GCM10020058]|uniref:sensor histidine kinase n=1 Tax=Cohnella sp. GCM10020058 TaxID=3317330 RepID=UPI0036441228